LIVAGACSDEDSVNTGDDGCNLGEPSISAMAKWTYTGDGFTIAGNNICTKSIKSVTFDGVSATVESTTEKSIVVTVPPLIVDSAVVRVEFTSGAASDNFKIAIFPGNGTWKEVASFPATGRVSPITFVTGQKAYIAGGAFRAPDFHDNVYYKDIYEYDPAKNTWAYKAEHEGLTGAYDPQYAWALSTGKLIFNYNSDPFYVYNPAQNEFSNLEQPPYFIDHQGFSVNGNAYLASRNFENLGMVVHQYNETEDAWTEVTSMLYDKATLDYPLFNFSFEHAGKAYLSLQGLNSDVLELWSFDPQTKKLGYVTRLKPGRQEPNTSPYLQYLFTIGQLAYFKVGTIDDTTGRLFTYNLVAGDWRVVKNAFPHEFDQVSSFAVAGRGFAGLGTTGGSDGFTYRTNFYEFVPR
jgi:hypothetical protein